MDETQVLQPKDVITYFAASQALCKRLWTYLARWCRLPGNAFGWNMDGANADGASDALCMRFFPHRCQAITSCRVSDLQQHVVVYITGYPKFATVADAMESGKDCWRRRSI